MDIPQGNRIDAETLQQLEIGMSREQVDLLMGSPAITDLYRPDQWTYVYYFKNGETGVTEKRSMTLNFKNNLLTGIDGQLNPDQLSTDQPGTDQPGTDELDPV